MIVVGRVIWPLTMLTEPGIGAMTMVGSGTSAGMGEPTLISPSGYARSGRWTSVGVKLRACFGIRHGCATGSTSLSKMRVEVAMEDGIAYCLVAVPAAVVGHFQREGSAGANGLAVIVAGVIAVRRVHPLMRVLVMNVMFTHPAMQGCGT